MTRFHRFAPEPPTDPRARRELVWWIMDHPAFAVRINPEGDIWNRQRECIRLYPTYVDPSTERIEEDEERNTAFRVWVEAGPMHDYSKDEGALVPYGGWDSGNRWVLGHDPHLDCGAPDLESALLELAIRVQFFYNEDGTDRDVTPEQCKWKEQLAAHDPPDGINEFRTTCMPDHEDFCMVCGFHVAPGDFVWRES